MGEEQVPFVLTILLLFAISACLFLGFAKCAAWIENRWIDFGDRAGVVLAVAGVVLTGTMAFVHLTS